ncbi:PAS domain S-box protein [Ideonella azotifigens]|uniref:histidine kinase n=2 Tax=Ideonella azotifigens TaxID=513160 RepID=A0ABP3UZW1_9BURK|nr:PAS domain S-box protein [Ideonella azotifigens]MCD2340883.1 PAS domain S-box protein [Ideonella azotifigens]
MDFLLSLLGRNGFLPHGYCFTWAPGLLWPMVLADGLIAAAYFSIPLAIVSFYRKRPDIGYRPVAWLFSAFIFACGITHVMDVWTIWQADYGLQVLAKVFTAAISVVTAVALWVLLPRALRIPSAAQLRSAVSSLEAEVSKRRSAEQHLAGIEQSVALTLDSIGAGFIVTDAQGKVTRMNEVAERVTGWADAEARGRVLWDVLVGEGRDEALTGENPVEVVRSLLATAGPVTRHDLIRSRNGSLTPLEVRATLAPKDGEGGEQRGMTLVFRDLTQIEEIEAERLRLAAIVDSSIDAIVSKSLDGRVTSWNHAAETLFGYTAREVMGQPVQVIANPEHAMAEPHMLADIASGHSVPPFDTVARAKGGRHFEVSVSVSPLRDPSGRVVGSAKIVRDLSPQRRAEAALRESDARLRLALDSAQIGEWDMDLATGATRRSIRHDRCFGYSQLQPSWSFNTLLAHVHPEDRPELQASFSAAVEQQGDWQAECRVRWPDGSVHWISLQAGLLHDSGTAGRMLGIVTDITQHKLAQEARQKAMRLEAENQQIQTASRLKSQFLANMSHELRTPLNAVIGFADLLHSGAVPAQSPKNREFLGHIAASGRHLLQLINDVLDLSKVESGKFEFFPQQLALAPLVREVCDVLQPGMQRKQLRLVLDLDPAVDTVDLDPGRLKQVLYNYLSNAIKFTTEGGQVTIRTRPEGPAHFRLEVEDTGIGIAEADLPRLFAEFQQLDTGYNKQHAGTGLGLALTRRLVQAQGGRVGVRSTLGAGSVFHLVLPRVKPDPADGLMLPPASHRLLVIESDPRLVRSLADTGFLVDAAANAVEAVTQASQQAYDAILLALRLSGRGGLSVLARIRESGPSRSAPVLALSMPAGDTGETASFPVADLLAKPLQNGELSQALGRLALPVSRRPRLMVVDDDPLALALMRSSLAQLGIDAVCLADGREALESLSQHRPDALILDLMMPGFDGFEMLDALQRLPTWRELPVLVWTSMVLTDDEYGRLATSARAVLGKGGGALADTLGALRRWRPPVVALTEGDLL